MCSSDSAHPACPWSKVEGGLRVLVRLTAKAARDGIDGIETLADGRAALKARVRAVPEQGKANDALVRLLADRLKIAAAAVRIESGATARAKTLFIAGDGAALGEALGQALAGGRPRGRKPPRGG